MGRRKLRQKVLLPCSTRPLSAAGYVSKPFKDDESREELERHETGLQADSLPLMLTLGL
jgi:hypothetical protein